jgi:hypothetical protein
MDYVKNGSMLATLTKVGNFETLTAWKYFRDIVTGLHYCKHYII